MKKVFFLLLLLPFFARSQSSGQGVNFVYQPSWVDVQQEASRLNKYILVDVYATWCVPCKLMDKETYPDSAVGKFINEHFIPVRVQFDTSATDNDQVKSWYRDAHDLCKEYSTSALPTFLFFSPDGKLVYREVGFFSSVEFLALCQKSLNPENGEFFALLNGYPRGVPANVDRYRLALYAWRMGDRKKAQLIAKDFVDRASRSSLLNKEKILFVQAMAKDSSLADSLALVLKTDSLDTLPENYLCTRANLYFMSRFPSVFTSSSTFFRLCYKQPEKSDSAKGTKGWSAWEVRQIITKEQLADRLMINGKPAFRNPPWSQLEAEIGKHYPAIDAHKLMLNYQIDYYRSLGDWKRWASYQDTMIKLYPPVLKDSKDLSVFVEVNLPAWAAFINCREKTVLSTALRWSELAIQLQPDQDQYVDTKANLLYKLGRVAEAEKEEVRAIEMLGAMVRKGTSTNTAILNTYKGALSAMQQGEPTYLDQGAVWK